MTDKAVVLLSGGIDSATCMALACDQHNEVIPVHFGYGQQTADLEWDMAYRQREHLAEEYPDTEIGRLRVINYQHVFSHFAGGVADPEKDFDELTEEDGRSTGYVPMRNLHFIASGAAVADENDATHVYHGAQGGDRDDYPDCRPEFIDKAAGAISKSVPDGQQLNLRSPLLNLSKQEVIRLGEELGVDFLHTYSCYSEVDDEENPEPCGDCPACVEREEAFEQANVTDPHTEAFN